jgi:hypothetical protein
VASQSSQTKSNNSNPLADSLETATERVAEINEKAFAQSRKAGAAYVDSYEKAVLSLADSYEKAASATRVDWVAQVATAQADFARDTTKAYAAAVRELVS